MKSTLLQPQTFEFGFPSLDTNVRVEVRGEAVVIRATRNTFSETRKAAFVQELVAEGFIDESYRWFPVAGKDSFLGVRWIVDFAWLELPPAIIRRARHFMVALELGGLVAWVAMMGGLFYLSRI